MLKDGLVIKFEISMYIYDTIRNELIQINLKKLIYNNGYIQKVDGTLKISVRRKELKKKNYIDKYIKSISFFFFFICDIKHVNTIFSVRTYVLS